MKVTMIGAGYVGLVSGACFSDFGHEVIVVDTDESKLKRLADGIMPIDEPGLAELVKRTGMKSIPVSRRPMAQVNQAINDLHHGKVIGRAVLIP